MSQACGTHRRDRERLPGVREQEGSFLRRRFLMGSGGRRRSSHVGCSWRISFHPALEGLFQTSPCLHPSLPLSSHPSLFQLPGEGQREEEGDEPP